MKIRCLPQALEAQLLESILGPTQIAPPFEGGGLSQPLLLVLLHTLFVRIHPPSWLHSPHAPLTSHNICILNLKRSVVPYPYLVSPPLWLTIDCWIYISWNVRVITFQIPVGPWVLVNWGGEFFLGFAVRRRRWAIRHSSLWPASAMFTVPLTL